MKFAVVDIETTGLYHQGHGITEIAVVHVDETGAPTPAFHSMVNPFRDIPASIAHMTGITSELVDDAPGFSEIAELLARALEGRIFVANNVSFDYRFLEAAFSAVGKSMRQKRLCTMRYARKLIPGLASYRLSELCRALQIHNENPHRAGGDATATAHILRRLMQRDQDRRVLEQLLSRSTHTAILPAAIDSEAIAGLPESAGIYYFKDKKGVPLYIGKAKNLKKRVLSHFTGSGSSFQKQMFQHLVAAIDHRTLPDEHFAFLAEDAEIKKWHPRFNRAQKFVGKAYALITYADRLGKIRFGLSNSGLHPDALAWFHSLAEGRNWLYAACVEFAVDPRRCGLPITADFPDDFSEDPAAVEQFLEYCKGEMKTTYVLGRHFDREFHYVFVENGRYQGYGTGSDAASARREVRNTAFTPAPDSPTARSIIRRMLGDGDFLRIDI